MQNGDSGPPAAGLVRRLIEDTRCVGRLARGALRFRKTGQTPDDAYHSMLWLHCRTNGRSNDLLHAVARRRNPRAAIASPKGVLGDLDASTVERAAGEIRARGYTRFPELLSPEICRRLLDFSLHTPAVVTPPRSGGPARAVYDREHPIAEGYRFDEADLVANPDVQRLIADRSLLAVAQEYLGCLPVISVVAMWWSTSARFSDEAQSELAQMYHFDMTHVKWLKVFFYLTEVTAESGPHVYIANSHRAGRQPAEFLKRGYARIRDGELEPRYPAADRVEITGLQGAMFAADTRGYHKGKAPQVGDRLMLQIEFADTLFGAPYGRPRLPVECDPDLAARRREYPRVYSRFS